MLNALLSDEIIGLAVAEWPFDQNIDQMHPFSPSKYSLLGAQLAKLARAQKLPMFIK